MNIFLSGLVVYALLGGGISSLAEEKEAADPDAFYWNSRIGKGINLGNALEAPREGDWGVRLEEDYFQRIADAGFTSVRIPVHWSAHAKDDPPYTIDKALMDRVDWAVDQALSRGLVAIINVHHYEELVASPAEHRERFLALWKQIAEHYKDRPETLYFEVLNEPCKKLTNELWNDYAKEAIQLIRESNPRRPLIIGPGNWNHLSELKHLKLPEDDPNLIVTFHYYEPFKFTHQGASWVGQQSDVWLGTTWTGTEAEKQAVVSQLDGAAQWSKDNQRPLYMGEFGAYSKADEASRVRWTAFVRSEAEKRNIPWAYWEFCSGFGAYDPEKKEWRPELLEALLPPEQPGG